MVNAVKKGSGFEDTTSYIVCRYILTTYVVHIFEGIKIQFDYMIIMYDFTQLYNICTAL